jgi:hypothetical protein
MKRTILALVLVVIGVAAAQAQVAQRRDEEGPRSPRVEELQNPGDRGSRGDTGSAMGDQQAGEDTAELAARIEDVERAGRLTRREAEALRSDLAQLESMREGLIRRIEEAEAARPDDRRGSRIAPDVPRERTYRPR